MSISQQIVPVYAAVLALMLVVLSIRVILLRDRNRISLGDGGHAALQRAIRVQANFTEYVPFALLLFWFMEQSGAAAPWLHGLCSALLLGRLLHAFGVSQSRETLAFRVAGMILTFSSLLVAAGWLLVRGFV